MKTQSEYAYIPDWQVLNSLTTKLERNQETDETEEENEYRFYSLPGEDHKDMSEAIRRWESIRYMI